MIVINHRNCFWAIRRGYIDEVLGPNEVVFINNTKAPMVITEKMVNGTIFTKVSPSPPKSYNSKFRIRARIYHGWPRWKFAFHTSVPRFNEWRKLRQIKGRFNREYHSVIIGFGYECNIWVRC